MSDQQPPDQPFKGSDVTGIQPAAPAMPAVSTVTNSPAPGVFGTKIPSSVVFGIGVLLFLMPFLDIRCNNMSIQQISGVQLATGFKVEAPGSNNSLFGNVPEAYAHQQGSSSKEGNLYATVAIILGVLALVFSLINLQSGPVGSIITGALASVALIGLMVDIKGKIGTELKSADNIVLAVQFTPFFYVSIIAFLVGAWFSYKRMVLARKV